MREIMLNSWTYNYINSKKVIQLAKVTDIYLF